ncbi:MAG: 2,3-bisphosphoglycerate-independent phosphoglycerate mutase, partial [Eubacteriales bacterium]
GILEAAQSAVHTVDKCVQRIVDSILKINGSVLITADHGNADEMIDPDGGGPFTAHTTNPVPCILVSNLYKGASLRSGGILADLAPTMLDILKIEKPAEMTGTSLIQSAGN